MNHRPTLRFNPATGAVDLLLGPVALCRLRSSEPDGPGWRRLLEVTVDDGGPRAGLPAVLGHHVVAHDGVRFQPRYPFVPGVTYLATANPSPLVDEAPPAPLVFSLPAPVTPEPTRVACIFPSAAILPANLLRLYVHFSAPMQRGAVRSAITLRRSSGDIIPAAFLDLASELWDPAMRRLTLILHPGRIKRGVGSDMHSGCALEEGQYYEISIDAAMRDAEGRSLSHGFSKPFRVSAAQRGAIDPYAWGLSPPTAGSRQPLVLRFATSLDRALLARAIQVISAEGKLVAGRVAVDCDEARWIFTPSAPWQPTPYLLHAGAELEDICGNRVAAAFDASSRQPVARASAIRRFTPLSPHANGLPH